MVEHLNMNKKTRNLSLAALFTALAVISLYIAGTWPTGQLGLTAVASLFVTAAIIESGIIYGVYVYIVSSAMSMLIVPNRLAPVLFILFFGFYPVIKSLIEQLGQKVLQILLKLLVFNISFFIIYYIFSELVNALVSFDLNIIIIFLIGNIVFLLFDYGYTKLIWFYINRISNLIKKGNE